MSEERVEMNLRVDDETAEWFQGLQKKPRKYLANEVLCKVVEIRLKNDEIQKLKNEKEALQTKLDKAEAYVEQGRSMIEAVMERWYHYDV